MKGGRESYEQAQSNSEATAIGLHHYAGGFDDLHVNRLRADGRGAFPLLEPPMAHPSQPYMRGPKAWDELGCSFACHFIPQARLIDSRISESNSRTKRELR